MELIKGNALVFLTMLAGAIFAILWQKFDQGAFRRTYIYSRKANMHYEYTLFAKLFVAVVGADLIAYYVLSYFLRIGTVSIWQIVYVMLFILLMYYIISNKGAIAHNPVVLVVLLLGVFVMPSIAIVSVLVWGLKLDSYINVFSMVLLVLDVMLAYISFNYWKKGDLA